MTEPRYEADFYAWLQAQAAHLRAKEWKGLDIDNLAEELDTLGRSERNAVWSHVRILLLHLLKWAYQPERRGGYINCSSKRFHSERNPFELATYLRQWRYTDHLPLHQLACPHRGAADDGYPSRLI